MPSSAGLVVTWRRHRRRDLIASAAIAKCWTVAIDFRSPTVDGFADAVGRLLVELAGSDRVLSLARRAVFTDAAREPALGNEIRRAQDEIISWLAPVLAELGSVDPPRHTRHLMALMDGLVGTSSPTPKPTSTPRRRSRRCCEA